MISDYAKLDDMTDRDHLDEARVMELAHKLGYESVRQVEMAAQAPMNNLQKYLNGASKPNANVLLRLSELLGASPSYLYGRPMEAVRRNVLEMVRRAFGPEEASVLETYVDMTAEQRKVLLQMLGSFAKRDADASAFERDTTKAGASRPARAAAQSKKK